MARLMKKSLKACMIFWFSNGQKLPKGTFFNAVNVRFPYFKENVRTWSKYQPLLKLKTKAMSN